MSQEEIIDLLSNEKPLTRKEIQNFTDLSQRAICHALKQLIKYEEIIRNNTNSGIPVYKLIVKRKKKKRRRVFNPSSKNN